MAEPVGFYATGVGQVHKYYDKLRQKIGIDICDSGSLIHIYCHVQSYGNFRRYAF